MEAGADTRYSFSEILQAYSIISHLPSELPWFDSVALPEDQQAPAFSSAAPSSS